MNKYRTTQKHDKHLRVTLTPIGIFREFVAGMILALPVALAGMAALFLPDYIGIHSGKEGEAAWLFWLTMLGLLLFIMVAYGARRATRVAFWELDRRDKQIRLQTRTLFGGTGELFEASFDEFQSLELRERALVIQILEAPELTVVRAWTGRDELETIAKQTREVLGIR